MMIGDFADVAAGGRRDAGFVSDVVEGKEDEKK